MASKVVDLDLPGDLEPAWAMDGYQGLLGLVRYHGEPIGWICAEGLHRSFVSTESLSHAIEDQIGWQVVQTLLPVGGKDVAKPTFPPISVVVCVFGRTSQLERCLRALAASDYPDFEVVVIDGATASGGTYPWSGSRPFRHVRAEEASTMARARNRGVAEARCDIIAFVDGDARPDPRWLHAVAGALSEPEVMAVRGLVVAAELETWPQYQFASADYGINGSLRKRRYRRETMSEDDLIFATGFGAGHNMAFRREVFTRSGLFSEAFEGGEPCDGSDLDMLFRVLAGHHSVVYEPAALIWYTPMRDARAMWRLAYRHGRGFGTYLRSCARTGAVSRGTLLWFVLLRCFCMRLLRRLYRPGKASRRLALAETRGMLSGLLRYKEVSADKKEVAPPVEPKVNAEKSVSEPCNATDVNVPDTKPVRSEPRAGRISVRVIRTLYPHWGAYSGTNQVLKHLNRDRYEVQTVLVPENDSAFPVRAGGVLHRQLRYLGQRQDMAWYNLSDMTAEIKALRYYAFPKVDILHYFDGEHSAQFLPRLHRLPPSVRPRLIMSFHQPPEVLDEVIRKDNIPRYDCVVIISPEQRDFFAARTDPARVRQILLGIDTGYFRPATRTSSSDRIRCVTVGHNYRDYKAVRAVAERLKEDPRIEFHAVSPRPTGLEGLPNVKVYKGIADDQLRDLYQQADILFLPLIKATANLALLEGMACGLPVVSSNLPSVKAYAPGSEAILVENNDPDAFIDVIRSLVGDPQARHRMSADARKRAEELDWANIAPQYEALYSEFGSKRK